MHMNFQSTPVLIRTLIGLGIVSIIVPFLGFPSAWRLHLSAVVGALILVVVVRLRSVVRSRVRDNGVTPKSDTFVAPSYSHENETNESL